MLECICMSLFLDGKPDHYIKRKIINNIPDLDVELSDKLLILDDDHLIEKIIRSHASLFADTTLNEIMNEILARVPWLNLD